MAISEFEYKHRQKALDKFMQKHRPPSHVRHRLDIGYRIDNQSVVIFEIRPKWGIPEERVESPVAKATFVKSRKCWKIFWLGSNSKWQGYLPMPVVDTLEEFLQAVSDDGDGMFFG